MNILLFPGFDHLIMRDFYGLYGFGHVQVVLWIHVNLNCSVIVTILELQEVILQKRGR